MKYRALGRTGTDVSVIGFGGASISGEGKGYGFGTVSEQDAIRLCHQCFEAGINLFDSAPIYGFGESERRIGKAFRDRREDIFIVSKCGVTWDDNGRVRQSNDPEVTQRMLDQSLRDLGTDYIDLYLVHWPDSRVDIRETVAVLDAAKRAGKIRHVGLSNSFPEDIEKASEVTSIEVLQNGFNLFDRYPREALFEGVRERRMGFMSWGTLDKGILTGRVTEGRTFDKSDVRSWAPWWKKVDRSPKYRAMKRLQPLIVDAGHTGLEMALGWVLSHDEVSTALCGVRNEEQLAGAVAALEHLPRAELLEEVEAIATAAVS